MRFDRAREEHELRYGRITNIEPRPGHPGEFIADLVPPPEQLALPFDEVAAERREGGRPLVLAKPPKRLAEMTRAELEEWGGRIFDAAVASLRASDC